MNESSISLGILYSVEASRMISRMNELPRTGGGGRG